MVNYRTNTEILLEQIRQNTEDIEVNLGDADVNFEALEVLVTATNALLTTIDADTGNLVSIESLTEMIKIDMAALEVLSTAANALLTTIDNDTGATATATALISPAFYTDDTAFTLGGGKGVMIMGYAGSQSVGAGDAGAIAMETDGSVHIHDGGNTITVDGTVTASLSATDNAVLDAMVVDLAAMEVLLTAANVDHAANEVLLTTVTSRLIEIKDATENAESELGDIKTDIAALEVLSTAANTDLAALEVLSTAANVDLAAIEVLSTAANVDLAAMEALLITIDADTSILAVLANQEDQQHSNGARGIMPLAVRKNTVAPLAGADGDYAPLEVDAAGALYTNNQFGTFGSILVTGTTAVTCGVADRVFVAIYMLTNTVFNSASGGLVAETEQLYLDDTGAGTTIDADGGAAIDSITFPAGMTLYGRYDGFTLASGSVVAYVG